MVMSCSILLVAITFCVCFICYKRRRNKVQRKKGTCTMHSHGAKGKRDMPPLMSINTEPHKFEYRSSKSQTPPVYSLLPQDDFNSTTSGLCLLDLPLVEATYHSASVQPPIREDSFCSRLSLSSSLHSLECPEVKTQPRDDDLGCVCVFV